MRHIDLFSVYYRPLMQPGIVFPPHGGIVKPLVCDELVGIPERSRYCDFRAYYHVWKYWQPKGIVGFQGYRKHFNFRDDIGDYTWAISSLAAFKDYQEWLFKWDGKGIVNMLKTYDILCTVPFDVRYNIDMTEDFNRSRSSEDWKALVWVMSKYGDFDFHLPYIDNPFFITTAPIFKLFMQFWWKIVEELDPLVKSLDAQHSDYPPRAMAFLSERIFGIWLDAQNLNVGRVPLLICWEAK